MKNILACCIPLILFVASCNQKKGADNTVAEAKTHAVKADTIAALNDSFTLQLTRQIMTVLKAQDYATLSSFMAPKESIRFSSYGYVDTLHDVQLTETSLKTYLDEKKNEVLHWGYYDGSGDSILLTLKDYFKKFVYDVDFINAEKISLNKIVGIGNTLNNLQKVYPACIFTESYFSGFEKKYDGMDWRSLRLVFRKEANQFFLVAIIHDQWTI